MILGKVEFPLDDIGFAEILAHLRIVRIEGDGLEIVADPFVRAAEFARRITAIVEGAGGIGIVENVEDVDRLLVPVGLGEREAYSVRSGSDKTPLCLSRHLCVFLSQTWPGAHVVRSVFFIPVAFFCIVPAPLAPLPALAPAVIVSPCRLGSGCREIPVQWRQLHRRQSM